MKRKLRLLLMPFVFSLYKVVYCFFNLLPVKNKVVATAMRGRKYSDDPRFVVEELHRQRPNLDIVWFVDDRWPTNDLPSWIRTVPYYKFGMLKRIYEMATSKVWINSHLFEHFVQRKSNQLYIKVDHGSMPLKKVYLDVKSTDKHGIAYKELINNAKIANVFVANSDFHVGLYRRAYAFKGPIYRCGFPRNDEFVAPTTDYRKNVREELQLQGENILLYVPTFRDNFERTHDIDYSVYAVDFDGLYNALKRKFGGEWVILQKFHPIMQIYVKSGNDLPFVKDVSSYANTQDLIAASDIVLSDYSSTIIDAAIAGVPGFTLCLDYDRYRKEREMYFEMEKLPFPFAKSNEELIANVEHFDENDFRKKWQVFSESIGMRETGHAAKDITDKICGFMDGNEVKWHENL